MQFMIADGEGDASFAAASRRVLRPDAGELKQIGLIAPPKHSFQSKSERQERLELCPQEAEGLSQAVVPAHSFLSNDVIGTLCTA